ncbi:hypothetical protein NQ315_008030 [Exocentrus adspersus]|uniref:Leucine-rich repeat-containing protein 34 n=1 Tax=Exocentrus adspersus TaxID=1586481 RepID=A0AAV8VWV4_9CUCU|nr:hypothetical protein NQ315_008030 [Exocentrus adspersus]
MGDKITDVFLQLFCEKNSDGTKHLRLKGKDLFQRIGSRLAADNMHDLANFLKNHNEITSVDLCYNDIGDKGAKILAEKYLNSQNNLEHLNLMHCDIRADGMAAIASSNLSNLKSCRINGNQLGATGARYIASLIINCPKLVHLDIAETNLSLESIESILIVIERCTLEILDMSRIIPNSYYTRYNVATLADDLGAVLETNETLVELHVQKCEFDGHDVEILLQRLEHSKVLEVLDLGCNRISDLGIQLISHWLKTRPPLRALNVSANSIKNFGARALSYSLPYSKIRYLDITNNKIGDDGMTAVLESLKKPCQMRLLYIWGNTIGKISCRRIKRMIASKVLDQEYIDVKICEVDGQLYPAFYPANHYKHKYYCVMDHGCPVELKIKRNKIYHPDSLPRQLLNMPHVGRYPPVDESLGLKVVKIKKCPEDE